MTRLFFDLDGTLTDSRPGIVACYQHALAELGRTAPLESELTRLVGPPIETCFASLLGTDDGAAIERAIASYRRRFERVGMFENVLYPGIADALAALARAGHPMFVVTSKPAAYARRIVEHFGIAGFFQQVHGPELGDRGYTKGTLIRSALASNRIAPASAVMIGDRVDDIAGARENGVASVGVTWGYGGREELEASGAGAIVGSVADLVAYLERSGPSRRRAHGDARTRSV